ncbi:MAG: murein biosynthesis integral membrane protein MurJ [Chloroflexota bacterium]|nr:murein biosynthesis integral membrane protein MurJ [Chloroflexota bacterium]
MSHTPLSQNVSPGPGTPPEENPSLARSATIISIGNIVSRFLGVFRETTIAYFYGATGLVSAFQAASTIPTMLFDLLIGGMLSAALVPVFSDYARPERRRELGTVVGSVVGVMGLLTAIVVLLIEIFAEPVARLVAGGFPDYLLDVTVDLLKIMAPALWFFALAGVVTGALFALKRFTFPAFSAAIFNLGIIVAALTLHDRLGINALAVGVLLGSILQLAIMLPDLWRAQLGLRIGLRHPALRRIFILYLPILFGLLVSQVQVIIDRRLASGTGEQSLAWMRDATTLFQLPHGLIAVAISLAALPSLSRFFAAGDEDSFRQTLGVGFRTILLFIVPATVGLWVLAFPIVQLVFERGAFTPADSEQVATALNFYLLGLIPASLDWLLNYTFYARNDTLTPALVGVASVGVYLVAAFFLLEPLGYLGLVLADSAKHTGHFLIMFLLLRRQLGSLSFLRGGSTVLRTIAASGVMALVLWPLVSLLANWLPDNLIGALLLVAIPTAVGMAIYGLIVLRVGLDEAELLRDRLIGRVRRFRGFDRSDDL